MKVSTFIFMILACAYIATGLLPPFQKPFGLNHVAYLIWGPYGFYQSWCYFNHKRMYTLWLGNAGGIPADESNKSKRLFALYGNLFLILAAIIGRYYSGKF